MKLGTRVDERDGWTIVTVIGDLDLASVPELRSMIHRHIDDGATQVIIDLNGCEFADSAGFGLILGVLRRVRSVAGGLRLVAASDPIERTLRSCDLDRIFVLYPSVDEASFGIGGLHERSA